MDRLTVILAQVLADVGATLAHNWLFLLASVVVASAIQVYLGTDRLARWMRARTGTAVVGAVGLGALTPFCSCGTTAVVLGAMASAVPWAPLVAFMVSSPLTSPGEYVLSVGLFGVPFATTFFVAAIVIGILAGVVTAAVERTGVLAGQARMAAPARTSVVPLVPATITVGAPTTLAVLDPEPTSCCPAPRADGRPVLDLAPVASATRSRHQEFAGALWTNGRRLALFFVAFATLGYLVIRLVPTDVLTTYLGDGSLWSVPLAAALGVPMYLNTDASLPLVAGLMDGGMGAGAALAFLVTGAGTSVGAISGMLVIARWKVVALVIGSLWVGAILLGYLAPLWL